MNTKNKSTLSVALIIAAALFLNLVLAATARAEDLQRGDIKTAVEQAHVEQVRAEQDLRSNAMRDEGPETDDSFLADNQ